MDQWDVAIIGGGILGTSTAFWLADQYDARIVLLEKERDVAEHTSRRNTGVIHRPFYLDPKSRRIFARSAQAAYGMWKQYAQARGLPFKPVGTFEVAVTPDQTSRVKKYYNWGLENGMQPDELELLTAEEVKKYEPHVHCYGAVWSKTDTAVDYRTFTRSLRRDAEQRGAVFRTGTMVKSIKPTTDGINIHTSNDDNVKTRFLINCAGGNSLNVAHMLGVGMQYTDLNFRGEYWTIRKDQYHLANHNIYTIPKHPELPFLDPHWIIRADGRKEVGPSALPVAGPYTYHGFFRDPIELIQKLLEPPVMNKLAVLVNRDFLQLAMEEWKSALSKKEWAKRIQEFLPEMKVEYLAKPGTAGVRASVIDEKGNFLKEAIELEGPNSYHITNYNSPGATGAPAFSAWIVNKLASMGRLDHLHPRSKPFKGLWDYESVSEGVGGSSSATTLSIAVHN